MSDTLETIRRSSRRFFSGTLLSRLTGGLRDMSMAYAFGIDPSIASFMVAFRFAHLLRRLFGEGALQSAFIPEFESLRRQNEERAFSFFRSLSFAISFFLIVIIAIASALLAALYWWGNFQEDNREILQLTLFMMPSLLFICLFGLNSSLLQCEKKYFIPSAAPAAFNAVWIAAVLILSQMPAALAMPWLSFAIIIASFCQWILTIPFTWSAFPAKKRKPAKEACNNKLPDWRGIKTKISAAIFSPDLRAMLKPLGLGILGVSASQINNAVDGLFAHFAEPQGPAFLWYAIRIQQLPLALFGIAIAGAILPPLSRALKANNQEEFRSFLHDALYRTWIFMLPLTAALFLFGEASVRLLYGRGDFGPQAVIQTTQCLWAYGAGLLPTALILVLAPASFAQKNYFVPTIASFAGMFFNFFLNTLFVAFFHWGAVSVAIATSISAWINLILIGWLLNRKGASLFPLSLWKKTVAPVISSAVACVGTYSILSYSDYLFFYFIPISTSSVFSQFFSLSLQTCGFGFFFFLTRFLISFRKNSIDKISSTCQLN